MSIFEPIFKPQAKPIDANQPIMLPIIEHEHLFGREHEEIHEVNGRNRRVPKQAREAPPFLEW